MSNVDTVRVKAVARRAVWAKVEMPPEGLKLEGWQQTVDEVEVVEGVMEVEEVQKAFTPIRQKLCAVCGHFGKKMRKDYSVITCTGCRKKMSRIGTQGKTGGPACLDGAAVGRDACPH